MRVFFVVILTCLSSWVAAFGIRGTYERVSLYTTYLLEEEAYGTDSSKYTIAPDCVGKIRANGRCTLNEFLSHIWKAGSSEKGPKPRQPSIPGVNTPESVSKMPTEKMSALILATPFKNAIDPSKAVKGITGYPKVIEATGKAIHGAVMKIGTDSMNDLQKSLLGKAREALDGVHTLRMSDFDKHKVGINGDRVGDLVKSLRRKGGVWATFDIERKPSQYPVLPNEEKWQTLNTDATIKKWKAKIPNFEKTFTAALQSYNKQPVVKKHLRMVQAIQVARNLARCWK